MTLAITKWLGPQVEVKIFNVIAPWHHGVFALKVTVAKRFSWIFQRKGQTRMGPAGARRSRRFNVLIEWCVRKDAMPSDETTVKRPEARAPSALELHGSAK